ncbi:MAG: HAD hydrolase-like protein, partial [Anaerolineae bacterium]
GDDALSRPELPAIAVDRAREVLEQDFVGKDVVIIGDTPADIDCGRTLGVKSIAVATGPYSCAELQEHAPDFCFPDLVDTDAVIAAILDGRNTP